MLANIKTTTGVVIGLLLALVGTGVMIAVFARMGTVGDINSVAHAAAPAGKVWALVMADEFSGSALNTNQWKALHNTYGDGNLEEACLTPGNVTVSGGTLKITAKRENVRCPNASSTDAFTSGFINTRDRGHYYPAFGKYEMRAKLPHGQGLWPAFWLRHRAGSGTAEPDVMEYFHASMPGYTSQTLHLPAEVGSNVTKKNTFLESPAGASGWHTWGLEITPVDGDETRAKFTFYQNGAVTNTYIPTKFGWLNNYDKNAMFDVAINLAVGGRWAGHPDDDLAYSRYLGVCLKPRNGTPPCDASGVNRAVFPATYEVDYVRVYALQSAPAPTPTPTPTPSPTPAPKPSPQTPPSQQSSTPQSGTTSQNQSTETASRQSSPTSSQSPVVTAERGAQDSGRVTLSPEINKPGIVEGIARVEYLVNDVVIYVDRTPPYELDTKHVKGVKVVTEKIYYKDGRIKTTERLVDARPRLPIKAIVWVGGVLALFVVTFFAIRKVVSLRKPHAL